MLKVKDISKKYPRFLLDKVSFSLEKGYIMGFIGSNGAGKTTTLKGIMQMIHLDQGEVEIFGKSMARHSLDLKQDIAFMDGSSDYYMRKKIKTIASVVSRFYSQWDQQCFENYLIRFKLDPDKTIKELSQGMRIKFALALALSHEAKLIILDEPTSGLDPVARDQLLEEFQRLVETGERSILFSTHITSDLEKCADYITFIQNGRIIASAEKDELVHSFRLLSGSMEELEELKSSLISYKTNSFGFNGLISRDNLPADFLDHTGIPSLDDIMIYHALKEEQNA